MSTASQLPSNSKAMKIQEKRLRKEEVKVTTEPLTGQLKARAKELARSIGDSSSNSTETEHLRAMYGVIAGFLV